MGYQEMENKEMGLDCFDCLIWGSEECALHSFQLIDSNEDYKKQTEPQNLPSSSFALMNQPNFMQSPQLPSKSIPSRKYLTEYLRSNELNHALSRKQSIADAELSRTSSQQNPEKQKKKKKRVTPKCVQRNANQNLRPHIAKVSRKYCEGNENSLKEIDSIIHKIQSTKSWCEHIRKHTYIKQPEVMEEIVRLIHKSKIRDPKAKEATIKQFFMLCEISNEQIDSLKTKKGRINQQRMSRICSNQILGCKVAESN